ncbi:pyridoxal-phosphate dependent enzyme [Minwuia thermotolerans]|uniref:Cysteine synthase B n=1 Tax=Minwuia thermotolerans TaxID=2056226 RepID=A0A2M9G4I2_9PROT|nr:cystathionine beta-synthase [Minwuia thermotolerans]PJK30610.1 cystathionine beta-synthase [Minwuia thermotolerans]
MTACSSVLDLIGNTPLVELRNLDAGPCRLFAKLESQNPGGSVKDRIGLSMIEAAERDGRLKPGGTLIEATAGNTGLGLALVAALKGYRLILVIPDKMSLDKIQHLKALGVEVRLTRSDVGKGHPEYYQDIAERLEREIPGAFWVDQFSNPANPEAHYRGTGPEILEQMDGDVDAIFCGVGSGGTITGIGRFMKENSPKTEMIVADPEGSIVAEAANTGNISTEVGSWLIEGIGEDFIPPNCDLAVISRGITVSDADSFAALGDLITKEGILGGSSTGTLLAAALRYCREQKEPKRVVTLVCDTGNKYLSKAFNRAWLVDQGLIRRRRHGDLRDMIIRRADEGDVVTINPGDTLLTAYSRLRMFDVSQLPVMEGERITGIIDESDLLLAVQGHEENFKKPVSEFMVTRLETIRPDASEAELMPILRADKVAIVADEDTFYGLITRVDVINHMRQVAANAVEG